jgi:predicted DNA-binding transcriptional regulator AlpA
MPPNLGGESEGKMTIEPTFRYLTAAQVCEFRGCKNTKLYDDIKAGVFPAGERLGTTTVRWRSDVVAAWLEAQSNNAAALAEEATEKARARAHLAVEGKRRKAQERAELAGRAR